MTNPLLNTLLPWLKKNTLILSYEQKQNQMTLIERHSQKRISFDLRSVKQFREKENTQGLGTFLNLVFEDLSEIVLCHAGIAFSPHFKNTGPLDDAPNVVCLQDFYQLKDQLDHLMTDESQKRQCVQLIEIMISILDGAKKIGLDVGIEEALLDDKLTQIETGMTSKI